MRYFIDSWAWIEYLDGKESGLKVKEILNKNQEVYTSVLNLAEVISKAIRNKQNTEIVHNAFNLNSRIIPISQEIAKEAGILHAEIRKDIRDFGLIDAFVLVLAKKLNAKIVTGDEHFKGFKNVVFIK